MMPTAHQRLRRWGWLVTIGLFVVACPLVWHLVQRVPGQRLAVYNAGLDPMPPLDVSVPPSHRVERVAPGTVWVNTRSHIYHYPGYRWFGTTIEGKFCTEVEAQDEGDRAAGNEQRPVVLNAVEP